MGMSSKMIAFVLSIAMIFSMFAVVPAVSAVVAEDDLIFSIDFSKYESNTAIKDTVSGAVLKADGLESVTGRDGKSAAKFTGEADKYIRWESTVTDPFAKTENGVTVSMWVNFSATNDWTQYLSYIKDKDGGSNAFLMQIGGGGDIGRANVVHNDKQFATGSSVKASVGEWAMITFTQNADRVMKVYVNGQRVTNADVTATATLYELSQKSDVTAEYNIGGPVSGARDLWSGDSKLNGLMESFSMYGRELTSLEIAQLYDPDSAIDDTAITNVVSLIGALSNPEGTADYLNKYRVAKAAYDNLSTADKDDARLANAVSDLAAAWEGYCAAYTEANGGKLASFTFEGSDNTGKLTEAGGRVVANNDAPDNINLNAEGKNGSNSADFSGVPQHKGISWKSNSFNPFAQTGDNATVQMWVKFHADKGTISGNTTLFNALSEGHNGESGYFIVKYADKKVHICTSAAIDSNDKGEVFFRSYDYTPEKDEWVLLTYVQTGTNGKLYINDQLAGEGAVRTLKEVFGDYYGTYSIGCQLRGWWGDPSHYGAIDDFTVYNRALSLLEIAEMAGGVQKDDAAINAVKSKIAAIGTVSLNDESLAKIKDAQAAYDALTDVEKEYVDNYSVLTAAWDAYYTAAEDANNGRVLYFDFEDGNVSDVAGRINPSFSGLTEVEGRTEGSKAYQFGTDKTRNDDMYIKWSAAEYDPFARTENGASITAWVRLRETNDFATFFSYGNGNSFFVSVAQSGRGESGKAFRGAIKLSNSAESDVLGSQITTADNLGRWVMLTITQDADKNAKLYLNDQLVGESTLEYSFYQLSTSTKPDDMEYSIGWLRFFPDNNFQGDMDDFAIYNRALTADEIAVLAGAADADYTAVDAAIAAIPDDLSVYTDASVAAVNAAKDAVVRGLKSDEQSRVDAMAKAINDAVKALVLKTMDFSINISDGVISTSGDKNSITWNANVVLGKDATFDIINENCVFKSYGVYYGVTEDAVENIISTGSDPNARVLYFDKADGDEEIDVYTIFGLRLNGVSKGRTRYAKFFITYEYQGATYTVYSDIDASTVGV